MAITNQLSNYGSFKYVVTGTEPGPFPTIQSALNFVNGQGETTTILVRPGTYTENLTLYTNINIQGSDEGQVIIIGTHTPPAAGSISITNVKLQSATHALSSAVAGTTAITIKECLFNLTNGYVFNLVNWTGALAIDDCADISTSNHIITNAGGSALNITDSAIGSDVATMSVSGATSIFNSRIFCPVAFTLTSAVLIDGGSRIDAAITISDDAVVDIMDTVISSGVVTAITHTSSDVLTLSNVTLDSIAIPVIDGTGTVSLGEVVYPNAHSIAGTIVLDNTSELRCSTLLSNSDVTVTQGDVTISDGQLILGVSGGTSGYIPVAATGANPAWAAITSTDGTINVTLGANTIDLSSAGGANWQVATAATNMVATDGYITKIAVPGILNYTLPAVAALGTILEVTGYSAGLWAILQGAGQTVHFGNIDTTPGAGGSITATNRYDSIRMLCTVANTEWNVLSSTGVFNLV
jgi:hypothetical protein